MSTYFVSWSPDYFVEVFCLIYCRDKKCKLLCNCRGNISIPPLGASTGVDYKISREVPSNEILGEEQQM